MGEANVTVSTLNAYELGFRRDAHQLLAWGYQDALPQIHCDREEEEITGFLVEAMREKLKTPNIPSRFDRYSVGEEKPLAINGLTGKRRLKLDIVIESSLPRAVKPEYIFEAKRLKKNGFPIGKYIGEDGLQCFVKGVYASQCSEAAMIGYIQSEDTDYWINELNKRFGKDNTLNNLCIKLLLRKIEGLPCSDVWNSKHERNQYDLITMYHIFINCS